MGAESPRRGTSKPPKLLDEILVFFAIMFGVASEVPGVGNLEQEQTELTEKPFSRAAEVQSNLNRVAQTSASSVEAVEPSVSSVYFKSIFAPCLGVS